MESTRRGRPALDAAVKRSNPRRYVVNDAELEALEGAAADAELPLGRFVREAALRAATARGFSPTG